MDKIINTSLFHPYNILIVGASLFFFAAGLMMLTKEWTDLHTGTLKVV